MKDVLSGGERERGEKEINSTTLRKCSEKDTNEILSDNRYGLACLNTYIITELNVSLLI